MTSTSLSKKDKEEFDIVLDFVNSIGLADHPPFFQLQSSFYPPPPSMTLTKTRKRNLHYSDLFPLERKMKAQEVRKRAVSQQLDENLRREEKSSRKGSVKDVFMERINAFEDPQLFAITQRTLRSKEIRRNEIITRNTTRVKAMTQNKERRSKILGEISSGVVKANSTLKKPSTAPQKYFGQKISGVKTQRSNSFNKLGLSLDLNKFLLVKGKNGLGLRSNESTDRSKTASKGRKTIQMTFNVQGKAEWVYPCQNESDIF